jgi:hypothetical protein
MAFGADGEYPYVLRMSNNPKLLVGLHSVRCTRSEAVFLVEWLAERFPLPLDKPLRVFFMGKRGKSSVRGLQEAEDGEISVRERRIALPATDDLRIGIVIHEYAHQLEIGDNHGPDFVRALDKLAHAVSNPDSVSPAVDVAAGTVDHREYTKRSRCCRCLTNTTRKHSKTGIPCCGKCESAHG